MSSIVIQGDTSGSITVEAPSVAGTHTLTLPKATRDIATTAQSSVGQKNLIINGDMRIAQRGTSTAGVTSGGYNNIDRFGFYVSTGGTWTVSQDTDAPTGQGFTRSQKLDCTTANASLSSGSYIIYEQKIEAQNLQHLKFGTASAESLTLSFWVKSNKTGTYTLDLYVEDGTSQLSYTYTIDSANTWEKKTVTIQGNTSNSINNDNGEGFRIDWWLGAGTDFNSGTFNTSSWQTRVNANRVSPSQVNLADSTSNYINITGVQLEVGENATPFENRMYSTELAMCQRYCQYGAFHGAGTAGGSGGSVPIVSMLWKVPMRATPTLSWVSGGNCGDGNAAYNITSLNFSNNRTSEGGTAGFVCTSSMTTQNVGVVMAQAILNVSAEL